MRTVTRWLTTAACLAAGSSAHAAAGMVVGARIHTMDAARPIADAMSWDADGRLVAVGSRAEVAARSPGVPVHDLQGGTLVPGLIDAHAHLMGLGMALMRADLVGTRSAAEVIARLREFAAGLPPGAWVLGRGWDQNDWPQQAFPTAAQLDAAFPDRPVWLERIDGHAGWANGAAMRRVGRDLGGDWQPAGGRILREGGRATGVFIDAARAYVDAVVPAPDAEYRSEALRRALAAAARVGLTGVHDMGTSLEDLRLYARFADAGTLSLRVVAYADGEGEALQQLCTQGPYRHPGGRLGMAGVKFYADGALGSRGAALLDDYADDPGNRGLLVTPPDALERLLRRAEGCGLQVATHAIGDRANRLVLDLYEAVLPPARRAARRWRVEHAQVIALPDIPRFAQLGVIASVQPTHATSDMPWAEARVGPQRIQGAYAWRRLLDSGARLALGSDAPVESPDPRFGLQAAVTRQDLEGQPPGGWRAQEALSTGEALRGFTRDAAWAGFGETEVGLLAPGLRADFVVLDGDPLGVPGAGLHALGIRSTWVDGRPVYRAPERAAQP